MSVDDVKRFCRRERLPELDLLSKVPRKAVLKDYRLEFNYFSSIRNGGVANIVEETGKCVEGVLFELDNRDLETIDRKEGSPKVYHRITVGVALGDGAVIPDVIMYKVVKEREELGFRPPTKEYMRLIIEGAERFGLSLEYIQMLQGIPTRE